MKWRAAALLVLSSVLSACGGGGGSDPAPAPQPVAPSQNLVQVQGVVKDADGVVLTGVTVQYKGLQTTTDAKGHYQFQVESVDPRTVVQFDKGGYARQTVALDLPPSSSLPVNAIMLKTDVTVQMSLEAQQSLQRVSLPGMATPLVELVADSLVRADGKAPQGEVTAQLTLINPKLDLSRMPGNFKAKTPEGSVQPIESFGAMQFTLRDADGTPVNLKAGQTALIRIPAVLADGALAGPTMVPFYHFNEQTGYWEEEGVGKVIKDTSGQRYYMGRVAHFSTWNADKAYETVTIDGCVEDSRGVRVGAGLPVTNVGVSYIGNSVTQTDANGRFSIAVKRSASSRLTAVSFKPSAVSNALDVLATDLDGSAPSCLRIDLASATLASYAGTYDGTYIGPDQGRFQVVIGSNGLISGAGESTQGNGSFGVTGQVSGTGSVALQAAQGAAGIASFSGTVDADTGALRGNWQYLPSTGLSGGGTYQGQRR